MYISFHWSDNTSTSLRRSSKVNVTFMFVITTPAVPFMCCWFTWMVCGMRGKWPNSCFFLIVYSFHDFLQTVCRILV